jgi:NAD(P)-dependent dehydrogenase (short-subunit alcohol dehydrogenase family)
MNREVDVSVQIQPDESVQTANALSGRWAVITGGSRGIGLGIADALMGAGAHVALVARQADRLAASADELRSAHPGQEVHTVVADVSDDDAHDRMFAELDTLMPTVDVLVANAGWGSVRPFLEVSRAEWDHIVALNLTGTFRAMQWAGRRMVAAGDGADRAMLVVSSIRALGAREGRSAYSATKAGLNQLVRVAALELAPAGVRVNALSPGITATPMALEQNPEVYAEMAQSVPMGRSGTPLDMGLAAVYLCSPQARFVTGANLVVDGGESLW